MLLINGSCNVIAVCIGYNNTVYICNVYVLGFGNVGYGYTAFVSNGNTVFVCYNEYAGVDSVFIL